MTRILPLLIALLLTGSAAAQTTKKLTATKVNEYALLYSLPVTGFDLTLAARKTVATPGPLAQYAVRYLHAEPILKAETSYELLEAQLVPHALADPNNQWQVTFKPGAVTYMTLTEQGFPVAVNDEEYTPTVDTPAPLLPVAAEPSILDTPIALQVVTQDMQQATSTAKRARLAAERIYEIRSDRAALIAGQAENMPPDGRALQVALDALDRQEEALTAMFLGTKVTSVETAQYIFLPPDNPDEAQPLVVARFSPLVGLLREDNLAGMPVTVTFSDVTLGELPLNEKGEEKTFPRDGLAYTIPGAATLDVSCDGRTLLRTRYDIAQYGVTFGLDPKLFTDKKAPAYARFSPLTGAIVEVGTRETER